MKIVTLILSALLFLPLTGEPAQGRMQTTSRNVTQSMQSGAVPLALRPVLYHSLAKDAGSAYGVDTSGCAVVPGKRLKGCFTEGGTRISGRDTEPLTFRLIAWGRAHGMHNTRLVPPIVQGNRVAYTYGAITEWWTALPLGLEQGFTLSKRPSGKGLLVLDLSVSGKAVVRGENTLGWGKLRYGRLVVTDADGRVVSAQLTAHGSRVKITVRDARAHYPLTVDPLVWIEQKVQASDGKPGDFFGDSVVIDGATALIGAPRLTDDGNPYGGAVYVFTKTAGTWSETQKLMASDTATEDYFGLAVAINWNTIIVGAPHAYINGIRNQGAIYIFSKVGGQWTQTQKLTASDGAIDDEFGFSVAMERGTAVVGARSANIGANYDQGAAYVFNEAAGIWSETQKLTESDGVYRDYFGSAVAIDGDNILIGSPGANHNVNPYQGEAYVFVKSIDKWVQEQKLTANDVGAGDEFGYSVALFGDRALIGAPYLWEDAPYYISGAAYAFNNVGGVWGQAQKLISLNSGFPGAGGGYFGFAVALSGSRALVGEPYSDINGNVSVGAAYLFSETGGAWGDEQQLLASDPTHTDRFGGTVAIGGSDVLVGAPQYGSGFIYEGAAYFYGASNLGLALSDPAAVIQNSNFTSHAIITNSGSAASPAIAVTVAVPAAVSFISASATQGSCSEASGIVNCKLGSVPGDGRSASANITLKAVGPAGDVIRDTASVVHATQPLTASAPTQIVSPYEAFIRPPVASNGSSVFNAHRGALPIKFTLTMDGSPTCSLPPASIQVERTAGASLGMVDPGDYEMPSDDGVNFRADRTDCQYIYNLWARGLGPGVYRVSISIDGSEVGGATFALGSNSSGGSSSNGDSSDGSSSNANLQGAQGDPASEARGAGGTAPLWLELLAVLIAFGALRRRYR